MRTLPTLWLSDIGYISKGRLGHLELMESSQTASQSVDGKQCNYPGAKEPMCSEYPSSPRRARL